jgi:hypothetical protein
VAKLLKLDGTVSDISPAGQSFSRRDLAALISAETDGVAMTFTSDPRFVMATNPSLTGLTRCNSIAADLAKLDDGQCVSVQFCPPSHYKHSPYLYGDVVVGTPRELGFEDAPKLDDLNCVDTPLGHWWKG